jgi:hypothetical protein
VAVAVVAVAEEEEEEEEEEEGVEVAGMAADGVIMVRLPALAAGWPYGTCLNPMSA